jgi:hypothetical protein
MCLLHWGEILVRLRMKEQHVPCNLKPAAPISYAVQYLSPVFVESFLRQL